MANDKLKKKLTTVLAAVFWLFVWQIASMLINQSLFLPSPVKVLQAFVALAGTKVFWQAVITSLSRIALGFFFGFCSGVFFAICAYAIKIVDILLRPIMLLVKSAPIASFIILALVWVSGKNLSVFISFLIVVPVMYSATLSGIKSANMQLLEMASVFKIAPLRKMRAIYLPAVSQSLLSAAELSLGLCWKSGIAAEVIGLPIGSIGEKLYQAKLFLMMPEMFAWTAAILILSWAFGKLVLALLKILGKKMQYS